MEFVFQENSPLPPHTQIKEQIKVALLLGNLRPGEMLPSIRDLEKELGINRNVVRRAYVELEELGILKLIHGKGVMVNKSLKYKEDAKFLQNCEQLVESTRKSCESRGLILSSFARYLYQRAIESEQEQAPLLYADMSESLARERAEQLSKVLNVNVLGLSVDRLRELKKRDLLSPRIKVTCNYYRLDEVRRILRNGKIDVIPIRMILSEHTRKELNELAEGSKVAFIFDERDEATLGLILEDYRKAFAEHRLEFVSRSVKDLPRLIKSNGFAKLLISNRIRNDIPADNRKLSKVAYPVMEFDPSSIEEAKMQLGIIA